MYLPARINPCHNLTCNVTSLYYPLLKKNTIALCYTTKVPHQGTTSPELFHFEATAAIKTYIPLCTCAQLVSMDVPWHQ